LHIESIYQDTEGTMWFGTFGEGLIQKRNEKFSFFGAKEGIVHTDVKKVVTDSAGNLWIATKEGIAHFEISSRKYQFYKLQAKDEEIHTILYDRQGALWIGTDKKLYKRNIRSGQIINYSEKLVLQDMTIKCLIQTSYEVIAGT